MPIDNVSRQETKQKDEIMPQKHALVIGLTGSFASGCSTLRDVLKSGVDSGNGVMKFTPVSLSDFVKAKWLEQNWKKFHPKKN